MQPESAREAVKAIELLGAPVKAFVEDCCVVGPGRNVRIDVLFEEWRYWCAEQNRKEPGNKEWFGRNLHSCVRGLDISKPRVGEDRVRMYEGIALRGKPKIDIIEKPEGGHYRPVKF